MTWMLLERILAFSPVPGAHGRVSNSVPRADKLSHEGIDPFTPPGGFSGKWTPVKPGNFAACITAAIDTCSRSRIWLCLLYINGV